MSISNLCSHRGIKKSVFLDIPFIWNDGLLRKIRGIVEEYLVIILG